MSIEKTVTVFPSHISGTLQIPASKSYTQRALALALLHQGKTIIRNAGKSADDLAALEIIQQLGANVTEFDDRLEIQGVQIISSNSINAGESGLSLRMFTPIAALSSGAITINGQGSLLLRPVDTFQSIFNNLGVDYIDNNGFLPIEIGGGLQPENIEMDGSLSSQFVTGFLIAFAKAAQTPVRIKVKNLSSKPYIDMTLELLNLFGYQVTNNNYEEFIITPSSLHSETIHVTVEGDWSSASCLLAAAAINGNVIIKGLQENSAQADKLFLDVLKQCGSSCEISSDGVHVIKRELNSFSFDATHCPDLFPALAALAVHCTGTSIISGVGRLKHKESDRGKALQKEFSKLGLILEIENDSMIINGPQITKPTTVDSHNDHRIAMCLAVIACSASGPLTITGAGSVKKSYPAFFTHLASLGGKITSS